MKGMCISQKENNKLKIHVDGQQVEQVIQFRYLGSVLSEDGYCTKQICSRIEMEKLFTGTMNMELKTRVTKCLV